MQPWIPPTAAQKAARDAKANAAYVAARATEQIEWAEAKAADAIRKALDEEQIMP